MSAAPTNAAKPIASATGGMRRRSPPSFGVLEKGLIRLPRLGLP